MFAFVIYDRENDEIFGARDFFGIKPFYFYEIKNDGENQGLIFGSEIKSFLEHPNFKKELNEKALKPYLTFQYSAQTEETFFKGVKRLKPGHYFTYKNNVLKIKKYWDINFNAGDTTLQENVESIKKVIDESVKLHRHAEVSVGSFLSGGVDSSYITACLMPKKTFSVGFEEENFDESNLAKDLSDILGIENVRKFITADDCMNALSTIQYHMDEPQSNPSTMPLYFLSKLVRDSGVVVVLSGEGADEIFGGYEWYDDDPKLAKIKKLPLFLRKILAKYAKPRHNMRGRTTLLRAGLPVEETFIGQAMIFEEHESDDILKSRFKNSKSVKEITKEIYDMVKGKDDVTKKQMIDLKLFLEGDILQKADKMSMAHSIELRVPFLDKEVMRIGEKIPTNQKISCGTTKYVLRKAAEEKLPQEWAKREKNGFPVPIKHWFKDEKYYNMVKDKFNSDYASDFFDRDKIITLLDEHFNGIKNNARKIYTLYTFLVWYERFFIQEN